MFSTADSHDSYTFLPFFKIRLKNEEKRLTSETLFPLSIGYKQKKAVTK